MNYSNVSNDWDQQLRDALADMPAPTDEEIEQMLNDLASIYDEVGDDRYWGGRTRAE